MPETYWTFQRLGMLEKLKASSCARKVGVQFVSSSGKESQPFLFRSHDPRESSETWHVKRDEFDQMMFENATEKGADCRQGVRVIDLKFGSTENCTTNSQVTYREQDDGVPQSVAAKVVVDATGQQGLIANKLGLREMNPKLRKAAVWSHFRGGARDTSGGGVKTSILQSEDKKSWFWHIPLHDDLVSVGVVGDADYLLKGGKNPAEIFETQRAKCQAIDQRLTDATLANEYSIDKEFSYTTKQSSGDGWVLIGDAWGFIDPVYSSGVYFAMKSAELAAECVIEGLNTGDTSARQLGKWEPEFKAASEWIRKLVHAFYTEEFRVGQFAKQHPEHMANLTDLLIGEFSILKSVRSSTILTRGWLSARLRPSRFAVER